MARKPFPGPWGACEQRRLAGSPDDVSGAMTIRGQQNDFGTPVAVSTGERRTEAARAQRFSTGAAGGTPGNCD